MLKFGTATLSLLLSVSTTALALECELPERETDNSLWYDVNETWSSLEALEGKAGIKGKLLAYANPSGSIPGVDVGAIGTKVYMFGRGDVCEDVKDHVGPLTRPANSGDTWKNVLPLTDVAEEDVPDELRWFPNAKYICDGPSRGGLSVTFVANKGDAKGWWMYTTTGKRPDPDGTMPFWKPYSSKGVDDNGTNADNHAAFVSFKRPLHDIDATNDKATFPFKPHSTSGEQRVRIDSSQLLKRWDIGPESKAGEVDNLTHAQQYFTIGFTNRRCRELDLGLCTLKYQFKTAVFSSEKGMWEKDLNKSARLISDGGQAGLPVLLSPIPAEGESAYYHLTTRAMYRSQGAAMKRTTFGRTLFSVTIEWSQFLDALRFVVAPTKDEKGLAGISDPEMEAYWGDQWDNPDQWAVSVVTNGQEISNPLWRSEKVELLGLWFRQHVGPQASLATCTTQKVRARRSSAVTGS